MRKYFLRFMVLSAPLMLVACGDGWEFQRVNNAVPYGSRTAGSGVAYVRAKMMPVKELKVAPVVADAPAPTYSEPVLNAEEIFTDAQAKSGAAPPPPVTHHTEVIKAPDVPVATPAIDEVVEEMVEETEQYSEVVAPEESNLTDADKHGFNISIEPPKEVNNDIVPVDIPKIDAANLEPEAGDFAVDIESEAVFIYENQVEQPIKEIISPKKDFFSFMSDGQESLNDIYNDPLSD